jgi:hypothetical protein
MPKQKRKPKRRAKPKARDDQRESSAETQAAEATTVAWTVSVTTVLLCDIAAALVHLYGRAFPEAHGANTFKGLLLISAAAIGGVSLAILPVVFRVRRTPPPSGVTVFAVCVAAAPILALLVRSFR